MRNPIFFYSLWCMAIAALFMLAGTYAWSPFASGRAAPRGGIGPGGVIITGPTHK